MERLTEYYNADIGERYLLYIPKEKDCIYIAGYKIDGFDSFERFLEYMKHFHDVEKELKEYKDLEEQGLLLRLPCKVGDTVWESDEHLEVCLTECKVDRFALDNAGELYCIYSAKNGFFSAKRYIEEFGKTLFLTKAEAEKKLAEMEK